MALLTENSMFLFSVNHLKNAFCLFYLFEKDMISSRIFQRPVKGCLFQDWTRAVVGSDFEPQSQNFYWYSPAFPNISSLHHISLSLSSLMFYNTGILLKTASIILTYKSRRYESLRTGHADRIWYTFPVFHEILNYTCHFLFL